MWALLAVAGVVYSAVKGSVIGVGFFAVLFFFFCVASRRP